MRKIFSPQQKLLAVLLRSGEWSRGLNFLTESDDAIQVGTWFYQAETNLADHSHRPLPRTTNTTQEGVFMVDGSMEARIYDNNRNHVETLILEKGDLLILIDGGHGYRILSNETRVLEFKNGPYFSREIDKDLYS